MQPEQLHQHEIYRRSIFFFSSLFFKGREWGWGWDRSRVKGRGRGPNLKKRERLRQRFKIRLKRDPVPNLRYITLFCCCHGVLFSPPHVQDFLFSALGLQQIITLVQLLLNSLPSSEQAVKTKPKQTKSSSFIFHRFRPFICCLRVVLWLDKGDFPENLHTVCPCKNK